MLCMARFFLNNQSIFPNEKVLSKYLFGFLNMYLAVYWLLLFSYLIVSKFWNKVRYNAQYLNVGMEFTPNIHIIRVDLPISLNKSFWYEVLSIVMIIFNRFSYFYQVKTELSPLDSYWFNMKFSWSTQRWF